MSSQSHHGRHSHANPSRTHVGPVGENEGGEDLGEGRHADDDAAVGRVDAQGLSVLVGSGHGDVGIDRGKKYVRDIEPDGEPVGDVQELVDVPHLQLLLVEDERLEREEGDEGVRLLVHALPRPLDLVERYEHLLDSFLILRADDCGKGARRVYVSKNVCGPMVEKRGGRGGHAPKLSCSERHWAGISSMAAFREPTIALIPL